MLNCVESCCISRSGAWRRSGVGRLIPRNQKLLCASIFGQSLEECRGYLNRAGMPKQDVEFDVRTNFVRPLRRGAHESR